MSQLDKTLGKFKIELSILLIVIGSIFTTFGILGLYPEYAPGPFVSMLDSIGNWYLWFIILGPIMLLTGIYYIIDHERRTSEFEELMLEVSKSRFVKNLDRIEELAWLLGVKYQIRVAEKKAEFKMKRR